MRRRPLAAVAAVLAIALLSGCSDDDSDAGASAPPPPPARTTASTQDDAPPPQPPAASGPSATDRPAAARLRDPRGDTDAGDLDIVAVDVRRSPEDLTVTLRLAAPVADDAIYSTSLRCRDAAVHVAWQRSNGDDRAFAFDFLTSEETEVDGEADGSRVVVTAPVDTVGCERRPIRFYSVTEPLNGRRATSDSAPDPGKDAYTRRTATLAAP